jgi:hypothetical protein
VIPGHAELFIIELKAIPTQTRKNLETHWQGPEHGQQDSQATGIVQRMQRVQGAMQSAQADLLKMRTQRSQMHLRPLATHAQGCATHINAKFTADLAILF